VEAFSDHHTWVVNAATYGRLGDNMFLHIHDIIQCPPDVLVPPTLQVSGKALAFAAGCSAGSAPTRGKQGLSSGLSLVSVRKLKFSCRAGGVNMAVQYGSRADIVTHLCPGTEATSTTGSDVEEDMVDLFDL
jgi:hypothetical protein